MLPRPTVKIANPSSASSAWLHYPFINSRGPLSAAASAIDDGAVIEESKSEDNQPSMVLSKVDPLTQARSIIGGSNQQPKRSTNTTSSIISLVQSKVNNPMLFKSYDGI